MPIVAEADEAQSLVAQFAAREFLLVPFPGLHRSVGLRNRVRHGEEHGHRVFGHANGVSARSVHDEDAFARSGVEVHIVHAYPGAPDDAQALGFVKQLSRHLRRAADEQRIRVAYFFLDLPFRFREIHDGPGRIRLQNTHHAFIDTIGDQNFHCALKILRVLAFSLRPLC